VVHAESRLLLFVMIGSNATIRRQADPGCNGVLETSFFYTKIVFLALCALERLVHTMQGQAHMHLAAVALGVVVR
jgi:hypothetical protein